MQPTIIGLSRDSEHNFSKPPVEQLTLLAGLGIEGDAHLGRTVQHRYDKWKNPDAPNLRQVHLIHAELLDELAGKGFSVGPGQLGENITTRGIDLLGLSRGTRLRLGTEALIEVTGLRSPCIQINAFTPGLMAATLDKAPDGSLIRKSGVMAVVITSGDVQVGDAITLASLPMEFEPLDVV
jgi:MOSC domain-containing protein YiiM